MAALEAMVNEVPVISSNTGGIPEVNKDGFSGYLSNVGDVESMTNNAIKILKEDKVLNQYKKQAREQATLFDINQVVPRYEEIYEKAYKKAF